ncbi:MAG TPA: CHAT domain-containing protein [Thermoanaerobaculia bacterium]|nr:CHAT domain-containing protein [Thermoanaerobaculia bacterium]
MRVKIVGLRSFAYLGLGSLLITTVLWRYLSRESGEQTAVPQITAVEGPGWFLDGPDLAVAVPAPQSMEAARGARAFRGGGINRAIATFRSLSLDLPGNAAISSDLAALYLARAVGPEGRAHDLVLALEAAEQAVHFSPQFEAALYNLAEARTQLHLPVAATESWNRYLILDSSSRFDRAQLAMATLHVPSAFAEWQLKQSHFETAALEGDEEELRDLVGRYPLFSRLYTEETLLPAWGRAVLAEDRDDARRRFVALRRISRRLAERIHDSTVVDTLKTIERTDRPGQVEIARGLADFGEGMARYRQSAAGDPAESLRRAGEALALCPLALWARFYGSVSLLYRDSQAAEDVLRRLDEAVDAGRYPVLSGRVRWLRGTAAINRDLPEQAIRHYRVALDRLTASEGPQSADFLHLLLAEAFGKAGEREQEWAERRMALGSVNRTGEPRAVFSVLYDSIESLLAEGRPWAALAFARELQGVARSWNVRSALAEASLQRGRVFDALGERSRAVEEFQKAGDFLREMEFEEFRERIDMMLAMAKGKALVSSDPAAAVPWLTSALERQRRRAYLYQQASLLSIRAMAFHHLGRLQDEEADLERAIETFEDRRFEIADPGLRQFAFEAAQSAFDRMVELQAEGRGDAERALVYAERSRGRLLLDQRAGEAARARFSLADLEEAMPRGTTLVEYAVLPDRLYIWTVAGRRLKLHVEPIAAATLEKLVRQLQISAVTGQLGRENPGPAATLYDHLIRPIAQDFSGEDRLAIVPDRFLSQVPFAALFDASRGRFLVEDRVSLIQPSASFLASISHRKTRPAAAGVLAVGDPAFDRTLYRSLPRLPFAADEARQIASIYEKAALLTDSSATTNAFVRGAPEAAVIHIAAHALLDPREPQRSLLVLRPDRPEDSGRLSAANVAAMNLQRVELVVLSVCRGVAGGATGRESVAGLAAGFLAAGARTVVASQWKAPDQKTRDFMIDFHRRLRDGEPSPALALRSVQLAFMARGESPAVWAGFATYGAE